ncbi:DUF1853 family protein [Crocinitomicaceae bacterium]|nr:DUF1853 family protein [Crocinitomicaceae bacterium]
MSHYKRYIGYRNTSLLWESKSIDAIHQFEIKLSQIQTMDALISKEIRLGKLIEQYVFTELRNQPSLEVLVSNLQIIDDKITIGEIDCVINYLERIIHLEIVYKFYLFDEQIMGSTIDKWIGPNRNDSLKLKLNKLRVKQLPLVGQEKAREILIKHDVDVDEIISKVYFKAQLFVPKNYLSKTFELINNECIIGYYMGMAEFKKRTDCEFHMPIKLDWLIEPHKGVEWLSLDDFIPCIALEISQSRSPLCWVKTADGKLEKIFVVFWR